MVRPMPIHVVHQSCSMPIIAIALFVSATFLVGLCAKHARKYHNDQKVAPKSPSVPSPKKFITTISNKALHIVQPRKSSQESNAMGFNGIGKEGSGEAGLWQKAILMGEKCQPPEFSGVIYYDYSGNRIAELPRSPRATPLSPLRNFSFPVENKTRLMS